MTRATAAAAVDAGSQVVRVSTVDLAAMASPYNPRRIDAQALDALRRSFRQFGVVQPVVVNRRSKRIVGGHQRVRAAELEHIATLPVLYVDLDDSGEKQLNLALNRIHGEFDEEKLAAVLAQLQEAGADRKGRLLDTVIPADDAITGAVATRRRGLRLAYSQPDGGRIVRHRHRPPICCGANWCRCVEIDDPATYPIFGDPKLIEFAGGANA